MRLKSKFFAAVLSVAAAVGALPASATTMVVSDGVFGAGSVLRDVDNSTEFLRLDLTMGYGYNAITSEFGAGGDFAGWGVATLAQMNALGASAGFAHASDDPAQVALAANLRDFFCPAATCVNTSTSHVTARGLIDQQTQSSGNQDAFTLGVRINVVPNEVDFRVSGFDSSGGVSSSEEVWLTREISAVPLPAGAVLLLTGLGAVALMRRRTTGT